MTQLCSRYAKMSLLRWGDDGKGHSSSQVWIMVLQIIYYSQYWGNAIHHLPLHTGTVSPGLKEEMVLMSASITSSIISSFYLHFPLDNWNKASHSVRIYNRHLVNWQKLLEKARQKEAKITSRNFDKTQTLCHDSCSSTAIIKYEFLMVIKENPIFEWSETI